MTQKMAFTTFLAASLRNKPGRNIATFFCFAFIAATIFSGQFLMAGATEGIDRGILRMGADQMVVPAEYFVYLRGAGPDNTFAIVLSEPSDYRMQAEVQGILGNVTGIAAMSPQIYVSTLKIPTLSEKAVFIYGIDPETDFAVLPWLEQPLGYPPGPREVIIGAGIGADPGSEIAIGNERYTVAGRLDPTQSVADQAIILRMDDAYALAATGAILHPSAPRISPGDVNAVLIRDAPGVKPEIVELRIVQAFAFSPVYRQNRVIGRHVSLDPAAKDIRELPGLFGLIALSVVVVTFPLIALIAAMVAHERQREIGLFKAMGAHNRLVFLLVFSESLVLAAAGGVAGAGSGLAALSLMNALGFLDSAFMVSFQMPPYAAIGSMAGLALLAVISIGSLSALLPAYRSSTMNPYDAIRRKGM